MNTYYKRLLLFFGFDTTYLFIGIYIVLLLYSYIHHDIIRLLIQTGSVFVLVSVLRILIDRKRPFEVQDIIPIKDHSTGHSFPSRHAASSLIIALYTYSILPILGISLMILALLMGISRVLGGIHYLSDIIGAYIISILLYYLTLLLF